jgi:hypothetical protein
LKRLIAGLAFLTNLAASVVIVGGGLTMLAIENSGERGSGALLALGGSIAFAAAMILIFARKGAFAGLGGRAGALAAAALGMLPAAAICIAALSFSGFPYGTPVPLVDWPVFGIGIVLALGAASVLALGIMRRSEGTMRASHKVPDTISQPLPQSAVDRQGIDRRADTRPRQDLPKRFLQPLKRRDERLEDDEVQVTPVELPSIGRFRRR